MYKPNSRSVRILVIEDNDDHWILTKKTIERCFTSAATVVVRIASAERALKFLDECLIEEWNMPNLILLDLYLPDIEDGLKLLKQIRMMAPACKEVPIVMLSSSNEQDDIIKAYDSGISSYCLKPIDYEGWIILFEELNKYWMDTVSLPPRHYSLF